MTIPDEDIHELMRIYEEEFDQNLTFEEAKAMSSQIISFYRLILPRPP